METRGVSVVNESHKYLYRIQGFLYLANKKPWTPKAVAIFIEIKKKMKWQENTCCKNGKFLF